MLWVLPFYGDFGVQKAKTKACETATPFASLVITAAQAIFGRLRRFLQGVDKLHVIC